ncbi:MAG TPA: hypothetical protein VF011_17245 [Terriglobales bacterium]
MSSVRSVALIYVAAIANCVVALATVAIHGWNAAGAHAVARNSARLAALFFIVAFAAPGLVRFVRRLPSAATLLWAWFAAHLVHFASVAVLLSTFERAHIAHHPGQSILVLLVGSGVVLGAALTASWKSPLYTAIHNISLYAVFMLFTLAFARNRVPALRLLAVALGLALVLRLTALSKPAKATATSAT